ncbi:MAG TPA: hypothetical protein VHX38_37960 [Pseudonocardiaceae bacterium]|nr:hypothetical protein [Pseudonocardiaceae bacterium]
MAGSRLTTVIRTQGHTAALKDGSITPRGFGLDFIEVPVLVQAFRRMVRSLEFDVSEMAFTTYLCAKAQGVAMTALPVFLVRQLHHGAIVTAAGGGISSPGELAGRTVGVNRGYTVTTGVWARGILQDEHGLDLSQVTWAPTGDEHVTGYRPPPNVAPLPPGGDLADLVASGELAAGVGITAGRPGLAPLIPDPAAAGFAALHERGLYPINHLLVVRDELLAAHPDLAAELFGAFAAAKRGYLDRLRRGEVTDPSPADLLYRQVLDKTGADPLPYGIEPNRAMIELLVRHAVRQRILGVTVPAEALFHPGTSDLTG